MTDLERIVIQRADEQCAVERLTGYQERDSWDVPSDRKPEPIAKRPCLAGGCDRPVVARGYCHCHRQRFRRVGKVE